VTDSHEKPTILCISTYEKGQRFLQEAARLGCDVVLLTVDKLANADWPRESLRKLITMPEAMTPGQVLNTVSYLARGQWIDRVVALDEFDLEVAALVREHMRLPGMGESATRFFRDKLAMRERAQQRGVPVPEFTSVFYYDDLRGFMNHVPGPWLLKPRTNASAIGIRKIETPEQLWPILEELGDLQSHYVLERFVPGEIFHVEGITWDGKVLFAAPFKYGKPPMQTMHQGGVFSTRALPRGSSDARGLGKIHGQLIEALGLGYGVTHSEFIKSAADGSFYFLETAARVGGAYIAEVVEFATGLNPWVEWARLEVAALMGRGYVLPAVKPLYAGSVICLARQERPDLSGFDAPEVVQRLQKHHHAGLLVQADSAERVEALVTSYSDRFLEEFCAFEPPPDKPTA
jgi:biotin carboxylase